MTQVLWKKWGDSGFIISLLTKECDETDLILLFFFYLESFFSSSFYPNNKLAYLKRSFEGAKKYSYLLNKNGVH